MVSDSYKLHTWQGVSRYLLHNNLPNWATRKPTWGAGGDQHQKYLHYFKHRKTLRCPIFLATLLLPIQRPAGGGDSLLKPEFSLRHPHQASHNHVWLQLRHPSPASEDTVLTCTNPHSAQTHHILKTSLLMLGHEAAASTETSSLPAPHWLLYKHPHFSPHSQSMNKAILYFHFQICNWNRHVISQSHPQINRRDRNQASTSWSREHARVKSAANSNRPCPVSSYRWERARP